MEHREDVPLIYRLGCIGCVDQKGGLKSRHQFCYELSIVDCMFDCGKGRRSRVLSRFLNVRGEVRTVVAARPNENTCLNTVFAKLERLRGMFRMKLGSRPRCKSLCVRLREQIREPLSHKGRSNVVNSESRHVHNTPFVNDLK